MVKLTRELDPSRWVIDNSGYEHLDTDILDFHHYMKDPERVRELYRALAYPTSMGEERWRRFYMLLPGRIHNRPFAPTGEYRGQPIVISECGGHGFGPYSKRSQSLADSLRQTLALLADYPHIQGFAYTQFCDVAQEKNGLVTFDRKPKVDKATTRGLLEALGSR
jgi:hypothetical protein